MLKLPKTSFLVVQAHFLTFRRNKKTTPDFFDEKSKTGLGFEIGQPQQKHQRRPTLQSVANPAVALWHRQVMNVFHAVTKAKTIRFALKLLTTNDKADQCKWCLGLLVGQDWPTTSILKFQIRLP